MCVADATPHPSGSVPSGAVKVDLPGHGFWFETDDAWVIPRHWADPSVWQDHGVMLEEQSIGATVSARALHTQGVLSTDGMLKLLLEQQWGVVPSNVVQADTGALVWAAGTFVAANAPGGAIREWFVTDGAPVATDGRLRIANFGLMGAPDALQRATAACEAMVRSVRFTHGHR